MNRIEDYEVLRNRIVEWIKNYAESNGIKSLVVGVSGGIDSAVTSTLAAETGLMTYCIGMPLHQKEEQESLSDIHLDWLGDTYWDTKTEKFDLSNSISIKRYIASSFLGSKSKVVLIFFSSCLLSSSILKILAK